MAPAEACSYATAAAATEPAPEPSSAAVRLAVDEATYGSGGLAGLLPPPSGVQLMTSISVTVTLMDGRIVRIDGASDRRLAGVDQRGLSAGAELR